MRSVAHRLNRSLLQLPVFSTQLEPTSWHFFQRLRKTNFPSCFLFLSSFEKQSVKKITTVADQYVANKFIIFGTRYYLEKLPWHLDFRLRASKPNADYMFDPSCFFRNLSIPVHGDVTLGRDVKVPWELGRFQYVPILGLAYHKTKKSIYAQTAKKQILSWLNANRLCYGIHWFNGMEVSIRSINWIVALQWLYKPFFEDEIFYKKMVCSLYDHMRYLEHNWEWYDGRTNNHYLANLVGYAYLCWFFRELPGNKKKWSWCYRQLMQELDWQVFNEGTSYEGSTHYHTFITELFMHGFLIAQEMGEVLEENTKEKIGRMILFIKRCMPAVASQLVLIGDEDSGSLLHKEIFDFHFLINFFGLTQNLILKASYGEKQYQKFGLSIAKQQGWHVTLRHGAYIQQQPTGHFHEDIGSVTIYYKGQPLVIDPGSYVYSGSSFWRNYFRSGDAHNTIVEQGAFQQKDALFSMARKYYTQQEHYMITEIYFSHGKVRREVTICDDGVRITDRCFFKIPQELTWHFNFVSKLVKKNDDWQIRGSNPAIVFKSLLPFEKKERYISPTYGVLQKTHGLFASKVVKNEIFECCFTII